MNEIINFLISYESFLILSNILLNIFNLIFFHNYNCCLLINSIVILVLYFLLSKRKDKKILILALIHFSIYAILIESILIRYTNILNKEKNKQIRLPLWLITTYCNFSLATLYGYDFIKIMTK